MQKQGQMNMQIMEKDGGAEMTYPLVLKFVQTEVPPAPSIELNKTVDEQYDIQVDQALQEVQLHQILQQLPKDVQKKLDGKMISYYD